MKSFLTILLLAFVTIVGFSSCGSTRTKQQATYVTNNDPSMSTKEDEEPLSYDIDSSGTVYEDGEDGETSRWEAWQGHPVENVDIGANGSNRSIFVKQNWLYKDNGDILLDDKGFPINDAHYQLPLYNDYQFILEFDKMKKGGYDGDNYCFSMGVKLATKYGNRYITFNPFYDREHIEATEQFIMNGDVKELIFPLSMSYVLDSGVWRHLRFDLNSYLHEFEPNNQITEVLSFYFQGGDDYLDNIRLVSE